MRLNNRGVASFEFVVVAVPFFLALFAIYDFSRYAITVQSLRLLANAGARAVMITCYTPAIIAHSSPSSCTGDPIPDPTAKQNVAPFLYASGLSPTLDVTAPGKATALTITASEPSFRMIMPIWGIISDAFNHDPSVSTTLPIP
jgi:TadE-like protein